jgi:hypothetical protein
LCYLFLPFEEREKAQKFERAFNTYFDKALEKMPEFQGIVDKKVIKNQFYYILVQTKFMGI